MKLKPWHVGAILLGACAGPASAPTTLYDLAGTRTGGDQGASDAAAVVDAAASDLAAWDLASACGPSPCKDPAPVCDPARGKCVACLPAKDSCAAGTYCAQMNGEYACVPGCKGDADCPAQDTDAGAPAKRACCDHQCVDVSSNGDHCGRCGDKCAQATSCCGGTCVDTMASAKHCGGCGLACPTGGMFNATFACSQSMCVVAGCALGYTDCNKMAADGCEVNLERDVANCGQCGRFCDVDNGTGDCMAGQCVLKSCYKGFDDCNKNLADGCEAVTTKDPMNCGQCGMKCTAPPNAMAGCGGGVCSVGGCNPGFDDCDGVGQNGCETAVATNVNHCGKCGAKCVTANGTPGCMNGTCSIKSCSAGFADCNMKVGDGCEIQTSNDPLNCKTCGNRCPAVANGTPGCSGGTCGIATCNANFGDCNNSAGDGCEVNLQTTLQHCGTCGKACPMGQVCTSGQCVVGPMCQRLGWKFGNGNWTCPNGFRMPTKAEWNAVAPCVLNTDTTRFGYYNDVAVSVGGCNCKWNGSWCGQPSIETIRGGRMCGDFDQLHICVR